MLHSTNGNDFCSETGSSTASLLCVSTVGYPSDSLASCWRWHWPMIAVLKNSVISQWLLQLCHLLTDLHKMWYIEASDVASAVKNWYEIENQQMLQMLSYVFFCYVFLCLDIYHVLYFNCKFVRLSHSCIIKATWLDLTWLIRQASQSSSQQQPTRRVRKVSHRLH